LFEALRDGYADDYSPTTNTEQELVERLAAYSWRLRRIPLFEAAYMQCFEKRTRAEDDYSTVFDDEDDEVSDSRTTHSMALWLSRSDEFHNALAKLSRYEAFLLNAFNRTLQQLLFLRSQHQLGNQLAPSDLIEGTTSEDSASSRPASEASAVEEKSRPAY
jgi:hypothetical protein